MADADILTPRSDPRLRKRPSTNTPASSASPGRLTPTSGDLLSADDMQRYAQGRPRSRSTSLRVLFMHGLESSAHGPKFQILNQSFETTAVQMPMKHLRSVRGNPLFLAALALAGFSGCSVLVLLWRYYTGHSSSLVLTVLLAVGVAAMGVWSCSTLKQRGVRFMVSECVKLQARALRETRPDVVVGSSWGGAILVQCFVRGLWRGPTILLAPAQDLVAAHAGVDKPVLPYQLRDSEGGLSSEGAAASSVPDSTVVIVHGKDDTVVPLKHSEDLIRRSMRHLTRSARKASEHADGANEGDDGEKESSWCSLRVVSDTHRLKEFANSGKLVEAVKNVMNAHHSRRK